MPPLARRLPGVAAGLLAALAILAGLHLLAAKLTARELAREASTEQASYRTGSSPWTWRFERPADLIAGRVFGAATLVRTADGLSFTSKDGSPFEIGLPLIRPVDLGRLSLLRLGGSAGQTLTMTLVVREALDRPTLTAPAAAIWQPGQGESKLHVDRLHWFDEKGLPHPAPRTAAMLRLRLSMPAQGSVTLASAGLCRATDAAEGSLDMAQTTLPAGLSAEQALAARDRLHASEPAAIAVPAGMALPPAPAEPDWQGSSYLIASAYALWLIALSLLDWPRGRWRAWMDVAACVAGPLWLIAGLNLSQRPAMAPVFAFVAGLLYALRLAWHSRTNTRLAGDWRWIGDRRAWLPPLALVLIALVLGTTLGHEAIRPTLAHALTYLGWALLQQWLMLAVVLRRLETSTPAWLAIGVTAALFALLHTPNGQLMQLCFLAELYWAWCFMRSRALWPVALAHAICALAIESTLAGTPFLRSLEVSARFFI
jgi:membrane protease YdiL (CAAX protease family)